MKILKSFLSIMIAAAVFSACSKSNEKPFVMEGTWTGKIGNGTGTPTGQFELEIKPQGVVNRINSNGGVSGTGAWNVSGETFNASYTLNSGTVVNLTGSVDKAAGKISGDWSNSGSETGKWYVLKGQ